MVVPVTNSTQLNTFDTIKTILLTDSTLNSNIKSTGIYEYEPKLKSQEFKGFPYMIVRVPSNSDIDPNTLNRTSKIKQFDIIIELVVEYAARSNVRDYCNRIINIIETNVSDLKSLGYHNVEILLDDINDGEVKDSKEVVRATFTLSCTGSVLIG